MDLLYPGLMLRVAPSASPGGQLEFVLDTHREAINVQSLKEASTGKNRYVVVLKVVDTFQEVATDLSLIIAY